MFKVEIIGNLGGDAELKQNERGKFISFSLYHSERYLDKTTNQQVTDVLRASVTYTAGSESILQYLKKGQRVYVRGAYNHRIYTGNDHLQHVGINIRAQELEILFDRVEQQQEEKPQPF